MKDGYASVFRTQSRDRVPPHQPTPWRWPRITWHNKMCSESVNFAKALQCCRLAN